MIWGEVDIYLGTKKSREVASKELYKIRKNIKIRCPDCNAKLTIRERGSTYYFAAVKNEKHSKECFYFQKYQQKVRNTDFKKQNVTDEKREKSLIGSVKNFLNTSKKNDRDKNSRSVGINRDSLERMNCYEIESVQDLERKLLNTKLQINEYNKLIVKAKNMKIFKDYLYINTFDKISISISIDRTCITEDEMQILKSKNLDLKNKYVACWGNIIQVKDGSYRIYLDKNLEYVYIIHKEGESYKKFKEYLK